MGDGWETARHPDRPAIVKLDPVTGLSASHASDWFRYEISLVRGDRGAVKRVSFRCIVRLGAVCGGIEKIVLDTHHFKGIDRPRSTTAAVFSP
jgi:allantoicase